MVHEFKLPDVGEGVAEGELVEWLVAEGDAVSEDQPVAEVETDKALVEVPAPVTGTVRELRWEPGDVIPVGDVFITFDVAEETGATGSGEDAAATTDADAATSDDRRATAGEGADPSGRDRVFAAPTVRRLARELDVDLTDVEGSGPGGRVTEGDVRAAADGPETAPESGGGEPTEATAGPRTTPPEAAADRDRTLAAPATRQLADELGVAIDAVPAVEERGGEAFVDGDAVRAFAESGDEPATGTRAADREATGGEERVPYRGLRRTIGEQMERSAFTAPHVTHHDVLDAKPLVDARETLRSRAEERGIRLTYLPFVMRALTAALAEFPALNAELDEAAGEIIQKHYYNIGFATATDEGLLVPVVEDAGQKGLFQLATEIAELSEKARDRSIARSEMQGGTFTVTNFGAIGGEFGTPIINHPEVAILGLGSIEQRPYVVDGEVVARETLPLSLSFDHRVTDGATAGRFTNRLIEYLEDPLLLLLD